MDFKTLIKKLYFNFNTRITNMLTFSNVTFFIYEVLIQKPSIAGKWKTVSQQTIRVKTHEAVSTDYRLYM